MPDLHGWITQQVAATEAVARAAADGDSGEWFMGDKWNVYRAEDQTPSEDDETNALVVYGNVKDQSAHVALNNPATVLRRCEADRRILARHRLATEWTWAHDEPCHGCGVMGDCDDPVTDHLNDCPELLDLGYAHGLTDGVLAELDKPQMPPRPAFKPRGPAPDTRRVPPALRGPNWKGTTA